MFIPASWYGFNQEESVMPIINTISPDHASGKVAEVYQQVAKAMGRVPNAVVMYSSSPTLLEQQWQMMGYYMNHPNLSFPLLTMMRMLVSQENDCAYCVGMNAGLLINFCGLTEEQVAQTKQNPQNAPLSEKEKPMLLFVLKSVAKPHSASAADIAQLKQLGWSDGDILDAVGHGARMLAADVIFNTFKIENDF